MSAAGLFAGSMADTLLRHTGGRTVLLRMPAPAVPGDVGEQLGLAVPQFQDIELAPAIFRRVRAKTASSATERAAVYELLVSAPALTKAVGTLAYDSVALLLAQAVGVVVDGAQLDVLWVADAEAFGSVYLYRVGLRGALKNVA